MKLYISFDKSRPKSPWLARITNKIKYWHVGRFATKEAAEACGKRILDAVALGVDIDDATPEFFINWGYQERQKNEIS